NDHRRTGIRPGAAIGWSAGLHDLVAPESGDVLPGVAELAEDLVGVLAEVRRGRDDLARRTRQRHRQVLDLLLAEPRVADLDGQLQVLHLLVLEHFLHVEDRAARHTGLVEDLDPRGTGAGDGRLLQLGVAGLAVLRAILRRPEARIVDQVPDLQRLAETAVHVLAGGGDVHVAVGGLEHAGRNA